MVWISLGAMSISGHDLRAGTAENYRAFAAEAHGRSALQVRELRLRQIN